MKGFQELYDSVMIQIGTIIADYGLKIIFAILLFLIGLIVIKRVMKLISRGLAKSKVDLSLTNFMVSAINLLLKVILVMTVIQILEIPTASFVAIIGAAGLGIGFALQGSLANLAGGVLILTLRPFSIGDFVLDSAGNKGVVKDIQVFYTTLLTVDNKTIIIPNGHLSNSSIINYTREEKRRVDLEFGVDYGANVAHVKQTLQQVIDQHPLVIDREKTWIILSNHGDSAVVYTVQVWCKSSDYLKVNYELIEAVKLAFDQEGIGIPYPHMDVTILNS